MRDAWQEAATDYSSHMPHTCRFAAVGISGTPAEIADRVIDDVLRVTVSTEEVAAGKPAPDGYIKACDLLGVDPHDTVGVEDSTNGIRSLHNAGMTVVHVPPSFHAPAAETRALCDAIIGTLDELTEDLLAGL